MELDELIENTLRLMLRVLNYLCTFWEQILAYRNDGEYSIDNMAAERAIRMITVQRKNSMFFATLPRHANSWVSRSEITSAA